LLLQCRWYWGSVGWEVAEARLTGEPDGSFLLRDSSDDRYLYSLSFCALGSVHHTRIEHFKGMSVTRACAEPQRRVFVFSNNKNSKTKQNSICVHCLVTEDGKTVLSMKQLIYAKYIIDSVYDF